MLAEERIVLPKVSSVLSAHSPSPLHTMPLPDYNHNQEGSSFGIKERKRPLGPTRAYLHAVLIDTLGNFPIK